MNEFHVPSLIRKKRDGHSLLPDEVAGLIQVYDEGSMPDYQMSALAMAIYFRGMDRQETSELTRAMARRGRTIDLSGVPGVKVDKHSTGGVGDKVSICLAPLVAACGVPVPMMSGRGLGHTGGTLDKLEAIPGFSTALSPRQFAAQVKKVGCALIGQSAQVAPVDRRLYALRDVTGTVESLPLITASILSKKLAEGTDALVFDVKAGRGAFMPGEAEATELGRSLIRVGKQTGLRVRALITDMEQPLGHTIGNALETHEALSLLHGAAPDDLRECTLALGAEMLLLGEKSRTQTSARRLLEQTLRDGSALAKMKDIVGAQGGDPRVVDDPGLLLNAPMRVKVRAQRSGNIHGIDPRALAEVALRLGAGRARTDDTIDTRVGLALPFKVGARVKEGDVVAVVHAAERPPARLVGQVSDAFIIRRASHRHRPLVLNRLS